MLVIPSEPVPGAVVGTSQPGFEHRCATRAERLLRTLEENSSRAIVQFLHCRRYCPFTTNGFTPVRMDRRGCHYRVQSVITTLAIQTCTAALVDSAPLLATTRKFAGFVASIPMTRRYAQAPAFLRQDRNL